MSILKARQIFDLPAVNVSTARTEDGKIVAGINDVISGNIIISFYDMAG